eukprot:3921741-Amphidinium_carterae.1
MVAEIESFVTPLLPSHMPTESRVLHVHVQLPSSPTTGVEERVDELEALLQPFLPSRKSQCVLKVHSDKSS